MTLQEYFATHTQLEKEWLTDKNNFSPEEVSHGSTKHAWWQCERGHQWHARIGSRTSSGSGCPYCSGLRPIPGETDLATTHPDLAAQWHPTLNEGLSPQMITHGSTKKVWWICEKGHQWKTAVNFRRLGSGCPYCSGRVPVPGENDLATTHPDLAAQWHPTLNGELTPETVSYASARKVWWLCENGHKWRAIVENRVGGSGCPICNKPARKTNTK